MDALNNLPINVVDIGILLILLVSAVLAYARGFVHEVLSVGGWIGAIFATFYGFPYAKPIARKYISLDLAADLTAGIVIFIVTLVFLSLVTRGVAKQVQASALNVLDRSLGFLFGLARGAVLICVAYVAIDLMIPEKDMPAMLREARSMQLVKPGAIFLKTLVPDHISPRASASAPDEKKQESITMEGLLSPKPKSETSSTRKGYDDNQTRSMDRAIDAVVPTNQ